MIICKLIPAGEIFRKRYAKEMKPVKESKKETIVKPVEEELTEQQKRFMTPVI